MSLKNLNTRRLHADRAMPIRVYNTLTRKKEEFVPLHANRVSMFVCGLTPQDATHMGHAKTYVAFDVVARFLRHKGYHLFYLQNVTDIEDRIIEKMQKTGRGWKDIVNQYFGEYLEVMDALRCDSVDVYAFATDYIDDIVEQIQGLIQKGHGYVAEDGSVYYDTTTFSGWGKLSGQKVESLRPGARIAIEERKRHPADFVLWRAQKPGEPGWDSPWGKGRPGWHIEDTAITIRHFGPQYDLHGGATELMFPHHESEIAQAERSEEHTSELQSPYDLVCRLLLEKKKKNNTVLAGLPVLFLYSAVPPRQLHSFPTRRSSDLTRVGQPVGQRPAGMAHRGHCNHDPTLRTAIRPAWRGDGTNVPAPRVGNRPGRKIGRAHV